MSSILASTDNLIQEIERRLPERIIQGKNTDALAVTVAGAALAYIVGKYIIYQGYFHPLCKIPGPKTKNILTGHVKLVFLTGEAGSVFKQWTNQYGSIAMFRGLFNTPMLMISDPQVLKQILTTQQYDFEKTPEGSVFIKRVLGEGLLVAEGNLHRQQRKILNPAFTVAATRDLVPLMAVPAVQLAEKWQKEIEHKGENSSTPVEIQVSYGLNLATLDIIGLAGFGQEFHALAYDGTDKINKLSSAYMTIFGSNEGNRSMLRFLSSFFPILGKIPTRDNIEYQRALKWINEESRKVVEHGIQQSKVEKRNNLLALMIDTESEDGKKMSIKELQNQCLTFLAAGHETASVTVSWCLWLLAQHQDIQDALREEVKPVVEKLNAAHDIFRKDPFASPTGSGVPTYDELNELPLLNNVYKETLRLIPAVPNTSRISVKDTVMNGYFVPKGTRVFLAPIALHHSKAVWGSDAEEFRPSRWNEEPASKATPYEYMPFLAGGRQCIGYRFAQIEMKIILAILISRFQYFEVPGFEPEKKQIITLRPVPYMTLLVKPLQQ